MSGDIQSSGQKKVVIVGLPNTGKTQIFNNLTGRYSLVSNSPLTTVEIKRTLCLLDDQLYEVIDTPGLSSLRTDYGEGFEVRNLIFSERPDVLIQCIDANQLKQSFALTADLLELDLPLVVTLNAIDETTKKGIWIDSEGLSRHLHVPVVESVAVNGRGTSELIRAIGKAQRGRPPVRYGDMIERGMGAVESILPGELPYKRTTSTLLLMNDAAIMDYVERGAEQAEFETIKKEVKGIKDAFRGNIRWAINDKRSEWVDEITDHVVRKQRLALGQFSEVLARLIRHPVYGLAVLIAILFIMYLLVVNVANTLAGWMEKVLWLPAESAIAGICPPGFWQGFLIGDYGVLSLGLANAVITVLPILSVFFLMFNILEDTGYIPNLCVLMKKVFEKLGLSGGAIMPLVLGFGCKTMATMTTRTLHSKRERTIAIYLIAFAIPCAPQMGLNMSILGRMGTSAFLIAFSVLIAVEIAAGLILNRILKKEQASAFMQELPPIRLPAPKAVLIKTYYRLYWFLKEAVPVFVYAALALFALEKLGILDGAKRFLSPIIENFLGLPLSMVDALILCMARHEAAAGLIMNLIERGELNFVQCIVAVTITTMFVPCFANIMAMIRELGAKIALGMTLVINTSSFLIAGALNWALIVFFIA